MSINFHLTGGYQIKQLTATSGIMTSIAGTIGISSIVTTSANGDRGAPTAATFRTINMIYVDTTSRIFIADTTNNKIRLLSNSAPTSQPTGQPAGRPSSQPSRLHTHFPTEQLQGKKYVLVFFLFHMDLL